MARGAGKRGWAVELSINTMTPKDTEQQEDHSEITTIILHVLLNQLKSKIINLFRTDASKEEEKRKGTRPFIHQIQLHGLQGEIVRVWANVDDGAMKEVMSTTMFRKVKHRLGSSSPSSQLLRVANRAVVESEAT